MSEEKLAHEAQNSIQPGDASNSLSPADPNAAQDVAAIEMPRWKCHKEVWALEIAAVRDEQSEHPELVFVDERYAPRRIHKGVISRHHPHRGDFFVVYADGYQSVSPRAAFLDGYTKIE